MKIFLLFLVFSKIFCLKSGQKNSDNFRINNRFIIILDLSHGFNELKLDVLKSDLIDFIDQINFSNEEVNLTLMIISQELKIINLQNSEDKTKFLREINGLESNIEEKQPKLLSICLELARWLIQNDKNKHSAVVLVSKADYALGDLISLRKVLNRLKNSANLVVLKSPLFEFTNSKILVSSEKHYVSSLTEM
ncbi:hypothetical protein BpHYR1_039145 [Brachionus plicatilis]|uniref:VWFA domain-containing protein n=1 Tax=Brachionus plicatilis TaxID=10195 RepID=A0A3M7RJD7_BRAPC|nr:hypothetical protein BpHYR1_039145 [Brachionus plicatilis]